MPAILVAQKTAARAHPVRDRTQRRVPLRAVGDTITLLDAVLEAPLTSGGYR